MNLDAINANSRTYAKATDEQKETIERVQTEFLNQINEGKSEKEAFKASLKAMDKKYNPESDELIIGQKVNAYECIQTMKMPTPTPEGVKKWLEVLAFAIPLIEGVIDWLLERFAPSKPERNENTLENTLQCVA